MLDTVTVGHISDFQVLFLIVVMLPWTPQEEALLQEPQNANGSASPASTSPGTSLSAFLCALFTTAHRRTEIDKQHWRLCSLHSALCVQELALMN